MPLALLTAAASGAWKPGATAGRACGLIRRKRDADVIKTNCAELGSEDAGLVHGDPTLDPIAAGDAHAERLSARRGLAGRDRHFTRVTHAVGEAAAVVIDASVGDRRPKAVQQKAVGSEQPDQIKGEPIGVPGGVRVSLANRRQTGLPRAIFSP
jgi:hypothetical protein